MRNHQGSTGCSFHVYLIFYIVAFSILYLIPLALFGYITLPGIVVFLLFAVVAAERHYDHDHSS